MEKKCYWLLENVCVARGIDPQKARVSLQTKLERSRKELVSISRFLSCRDLHGIVVELVNIRAFGM